MHTIVHKLSIKQQDHGHSLLLQMPSQISSVLGLEKKSTSSIIKIWTHLFKEWLVELGVFAFEIVQFLVEL